MKRTKILAVIAAFVLAFGSFAGCNTNKDDPETVVCTIQNAGYGYRWLEAVAKAYTAKTGIAVKVNAVSVEGQVSMQTLSANGNATDVYFNLADSDNFYKNLAQGDKVIAGYDTVYTDISDLYQYEPEGFGGKTIADLTSDIGMRNVTYGGKQYGFTWATGLEGIVYNHDMFEEYNLTVPNTTDELFKLCEDINDLKRAGTVAADVYPFNWSGEGYWVTPILNWWFQYEGKQAYDYYVEGKYSDGKYNSDIFWEDGLFHAMGIVEDILDPAIDPSIASGSANAPFNTYANPECVGWSFTRSQISFLEKDAFMMPNGDWLERETEANFDADEIDIRMMKQPLLSRIIDKLSTVENDEQLSELVAYIDGGKSATLSKNYSETDIARVEEARHFVSSMAPSQVGYIPSYSNNIDGAKEFLKYLFSYEGQKIMMSNSFGNRCVYYDFSNDSAVYSTLSDYRKDIDAIAMREKAMWIGLEGWSPMVHLGGFPLRFFDPGTTLGIPKTSMTYKDSVTLVTERHNQYAATYSEMMTAAGVSND